MNTYDYPTKSVTTDRIPVNEYNVLVASDRELLNEAYRRGLISRFETSQSLASYLIHEDPDYQTHALKCAMHEMSEMALHQDEKKRFVEISGLERFFDGYDFRYSIEPVTLNYEMYVCSHPKHVRKTRRK